MDEEKSLRDFVAVETLDRPQNTRSVKGNVLLENNFINPYWFMNYLIGYHNPDFSIFKLVRNSKNFTTRKYPEHTQVSRAVIIDFVYRKKTRKIYIEVDGEIKYWTTPLTWFSKGLKDRLTPDQEDHLFLSLSLLHEVKA